MKNLSNYFKLKKYLIFIEKYPRVQNLAKINNKFLKQILFKFYLYFIKKNKNLNYFFFEKPREIKNIWFDVNDIFNENYKLFESLSQNGIIIVQNVVDEEELKKIKNYFNEITSKNIVSEWLTPEIVDAASIKYKNEKKNVEISYMRKDVKYLPTLEKLSQILTKKIFGDIVNTSAEFFVHNCKFNEEKNNIYEDTNFHIDRYLPCLKIIYSPNAIQSTDAPFGFIKKTHKLNNEFMKNFIINTKNFIIKNDEINKELTENIVKAECPPNSLIITFTNGFHKRNIFLKNDTIRKTVFFQYTSNFNTMSLLNFKKYNSLSKIEKKIN